MNPEMASATFFLCHSNIQMEFLLTTSNLKFHKYCDILMYLTYRLNYILRLS